MTLRFVESGESLTRMNKDADGKDVLVPLTGSMYVPGKLTNADKVTVDIGTGYYVEKSSKDAKDYFDRKVKFVTENMERVQGIGNEKAKIRSVEYYRLNINIINLIKFIVIFQGTCYGCNARQVESSIFSTSGCCCQVQLELVRPKVTRYFPQ